jgi:ATP-binding cassette subfamily E protein 1
MSEEEKKKQEELKKRANFVYPAMTKTLGPFKLSVESGVFSPSETIVMLGQNGTGKTTMIKMLAGLLPADGDGTAMPKLNVSYKPQTIAPKFEGSVEMLFNSKLKGSW